MTLRRILVVDTMGGLGDLVLALPMIHALAASHPAAELHVATTAPWHVLLERDPAVSSIVPVPGRDEATVRRAVAKALAAVAPDLAVTTSRLHGLPDLLQAGAAHAVTNLWQKPPADELVDIRYCRLLADDGWIDTGSVDAGRIGPPRVVLGQDEVEAAARLLRSLVPDGPPVLCFPDSGMAVKRWPGGAWRQLVETLRDSGRHPVVVTEASVARADLVEAGATAAPALPVRALAALAAAAADRDGAGAGGDTGPVRLATAAGLRCVGLYGPTVPGRYGLREPASRNLFGLPSCAVRRPLSITEQECWWSARCPLSDDHAPACMDDIRPEQVLAALLAE